MNIFDAYLIFFSRLPTRAEELASTSREIVITEPVGFLEDEFDWLVEVLQ